MILVTTDGLGVCFFGTKKDALAMYPDAKVRRCETLFFKGWIALDIYGTENNGTLLTPDGRKIPVVSGFFNGHLIGMRGAAVYGKHAEAWAEIMKRVVRETMEVAK